MTVHLHPTAPIAPDAILPGDPGRALALAQDLLEGPRMSNHHRGLWGYYGETKAGGRPLTIQSTGIGGPSSAVVLAELAELGGRRTCSRPFTRPLPRRRRSRSPRPTFTTGLRARARSSTTRPRSTSPPPL